MKVCICVCVALTGSLGLSHVGRGKRFVVWGTGGMEFSVTGAGKPQGSRFKGSSGVWIWICWDSRGQLEIQEPVYEAVGAQVPGGLGRVRLGKGGVINLKVNSGVEECWSWPVRCLFRGVVLLQCAVSLSSFRADFSLLWENSVLLLSSFFNLVLVCFISHLRKKCSYFL